MQYAYIPPPVQLLLLVPREAPPAAAAAAAATTCNFFYSRRTRTPAAAAAAAATTCNFFYSRRTRTRPNLRYCWTQHRRRRQTGLPENVVTERCNLRCTSCMPEEGVPLQPKAHLLQIQYRNCTVLEGVVAGGSPAERSRGEGGRSSPGRRDPE